VGAGVGMNALALYRETGWRTIHNVYLEYAVELGLPGLMLFLLLLAACIKSVVLVQQRSAEVPGFREFFYLAEGIQISLLAFSVAALFSPVGYHLYFYYVAGLAIAIKSLWAEEESKLARLTPRSPRGSVSARPQSPDRLSVPPEQHQETHHGCKEARSAARSLFDVSAVK